MFKKLQIKKKLILSFLILTVIANISGILGVFVCKDMNHRYSETLIKHGFAQGDIGLLGMNVVEVTDALKSAAGYQYPEEIQTEMNTYNEIRHDGDTYLDKIAPTISSEKGRTAFSALENAYDAYLKEADSIMSSISPNMSNEQRMAVQEKLKTNSQFSNLYKEFYAACENLMQEKSALATATDQSLSKSMSISVGIALVLIVLSFSLSMGFGISIARSISAPINACVARLLAFKKGDISSPAPQVNTEDEMYALANTLDQIVDHLNRVFKDIIYVFKEMSQGNYDIYSNVRELYIGDLTPILEAMQTLKANMVSTLQQIRQSSDQVAGGSEQVATASLALSQGATEQASSIQELAATIDEISKRVNENAQHSNTASEVAGEAGTNLQNCNHQMQELTVAMDEISTCSSEIGKIIKTIEDIAFQTNILALNAAVEAARAGTAGKGFAVVADEVRNLASKSAEASKNTATLIANAIRAVENGSAIVNTTASSMDIAVQGAEKAVNLLEQINAASHEQAESVSQVSIGIDQISAIVQTNSATAEEVAASSKELSTQADLMKNLVKKFKLSSAAQSGGTEGVGAASGNYGYAPAASDAFSNASYDPRDMMEDDSMDGGYGLGYNDKY